MRSPVIVTAALSANRSAHTPCMARRSRGPSSARRCLGSGAGANARADSANNNSRIRATSANPLECHEESILRRLLERRPTFACAVDGDDLPSDRDRASPLDRGLDVVEVLQESLLHHALEQE